MRILLAFCWFVVTAVVIRWIVIPVLVWLLPEIGISGFPAASIGGGLILIAFLYFLIGVIAGWSFKSPWDRTRV